MTSQKLLVLPTVSALNITTVLHALIHHITPVLFLLIPDQVQPGVFNEQFAPSLKTDATVVIASGYNVFFKLLQFRPGQDVVMVAPRSVCISLSKRAVNSPSVIVKDDWKFCAFAVPERKGISLLRFC